MSRSGTETGSSMGSLEVLTSKLLEVQFSNDQIRSIPSAVHTVIAILLSLSLFKALPCLQPT